MGGWSQVAVILTVQQGLRARLILAHWWVGLIVRQLLAIPGGGGGVTRAGAGLLEESTSFNFFFK